MDKQILFLLIGFVIWVLQFILKSRSKSKRAQQVLNSPKQITSKKDDSPFYGVLQKFSNTLRKDLNEKNNVKSGLEIVENIVSSTTSEDGSFLKKYKKKRSSSHYVIEKLKTSKGIREAFINSEILKTKF